MIRVPQVRVVDEEGAQLGVMPTPDALAMAQERGLDLVEVAPMASPPVVKFLDFGQYKYELTKREKEAKRKQRSVTFKEIRLSPKIGVGDFDTKVRRAIQFLEEGDRIKVAVQFRGRELTHPEIGRTLLTRFSEQIKDHGVVERAPLLEGKSMHITVASVHKPKPIEHPTRHGVEIDGAESAGEPEAPVAAARPAATPPAEAPAAEAPAAEAPAEAAEPEAGPAAAPAEATEPEQVATAEAPEAPEPAPATTRTPARTTATKAAAAATNDVPKPARAPARTRKTTGTEASASAPAGE